MRTLIWIRLSLLLTILVSFLPFMIEKGMQIRGDVTVNLANANRDVAQSVDLAQNQFRQIRSEVENTLKAFTLLTQTLRYVTPTVCSSTIDGLRRTQQKISSISILTPQGTTYCSSQAGREGVSLADDTVFKASIQQNDAAWTDLSVDPATGHLVIGAAMAFRDGNDVAFVAKIEVDSQVLVASLVNAFRIPDAAIFLVAQSGDILLSESPDVRTNDRSPFPPELKRRIIALSQGTIDAGSYGAGENIIGVSLLSGTSIRLVSVLPIRGVFASADQKMVTGLLILLAEATIITFVMMAVIEFTLLGALRSLVGVAEEISAGNVLARAAVKTPFLDLHLLAKAFNIMVDRLELAALFDGLTNLPNRRHLDQHCDSSRQRFSRYGVPFSIAMIDVDHFKRFNDLHGHLAGDEALKQISAVLNDFVRRPDEIAGRYGGEEFLLILTEVNRVKIAAHLNRLRQAVEELSIFLSASERGAVTISIGFTVARRDEAIETLIGRADAALYAIKAAGRNGVLCLDEDVLSEQADQGPDSLAYSC